MFLLTKKKKKLKLSRQCGSLCINTKEKCRLYFVFYGHKLCKVNVINAIVCKKSSFKVDIRQKQENLLFYDPSLTRKKGPLDKRDWLF